MHVGEEARFFQVLCKSTTGPTKYDCKCHEYLYEMYSAVAALQNGFKKRCRMGWLQQSQILSAQSSTLKPFASDNCCLAAVGKIHKSTVSAAKPLQM